jgi:hypothetical protein
MARKHLAEFEKEIVNWAPSLERKGGRMLVLCGIGGPLGWTWRFADGVSPWESLGFTCDDNANIVGGEARLPGANPRERFAFKRFPSGAGDAMHDLTAKDLAELGHDVFYLAPRCGPASRDGHHADR